ncbi:MAG TPA: hypothetical protein VED01_13300 [Burkholderiales bacterium]|nr:hypothetical protein [Burkholderiales bacterium]
MSVFSSLPEHTLIGFDELPVDRRLTMLGALLAEDGTAVSGYVTEALALAWLEQNGRREGVEQINTLPPINAVREMARGMIAQKQVRDINPQQFLVAERRLAKAAINSAAKGDYASAAFQKQRQILNYELFKAAQDARERVDATITYLRKFERRPVRESLGKAGLPYLDQIDGLLERFELKAITRQEERERQSLAEWHARQLELGYEPAIDQHVLNEAYRVNYRSMTFEQIEGLRDAVKSIEHLARHVGQIRKGNERVAFEDALHELIERAESSRRYIKPSKERILKGWADRLRDRTAGLDTSLIPVETLVEMLDGGAVGPWHDYFFNRASAAQAEELDTDLTFAEKLNGIVEAFVGADSARMVDLFDTGLQADPMSRYKLVSIALNIGNESNFDKMLRGNVWTREQVITAVRKLDARDLRFVQQVWDTIGELYPRLSALQQAVSGLPLAKVEPTPITIKTTAGETVELRGGYYPLRYDPRLSEAGTKQETGPLAGLTERGYVRATVPGGHRKERTGFAAPLLLDFGEVVQRHVAGVIKDLSHREFLIDANKLLTNGQIRQALQTRLGEDYERMFLPWLKGVANDRVASPAEGLTGFDKFFEGARSSVTTVALGFKVTTIFAQLGGVPNAAEYIGKEYGLKFLADATRVTAAHPLETFRTVVEKSGEMRHRFTTRDRDTRDELRRIAQTKTGRAVQWVQRAAFYGINVADRLITVPTWLAGYNGALAGGATEEQAIHAGDAAVRRTQGAGGAKDLSEVQRRRGAMKLLTMFYTPFAAQYGRLRDVGAEARVEGFAYAPEAVLRVAMVAMLPSIISDILAGRGPKECRIDDAECLAKWAAIKSVFSLTAVVPVLRDIGNALERRLNEGKGGDPRFSPVLDAFQRIAKTVQRDAESAFGDRPFDSDLFFDNMEMSGYLLGLPTSQPRITLEYLYDVASGETYPEDAQSFLRDLVFRREKQ